MIRATICELGHDGSMFLKLDSGPYRRVRTAGLLQARLRELFPEGIKCGESRIEYEETDAILNLKTLKRGEP